MASNHLDNANRERSEPTFFSNLVIQWAATSRKLEVSSMEQTIRLNYGNVLPQRR